MAHTIQDIAQALGAECFGATDLVVTGAAQPSDAGPDDLALAMSPAYAPGLAKGQARAAVLWPGADWQALGLKAAIIAPRARLAMARLTQMLDTPHAIDDGIHPTAIIGQGADIGAGVAIGPFCVIGAGAKIGAGTRIASHVTINPGVVLGADCLILDGVRLLRRVRLGDRVMLHPGVVLGGDGFSFVTTETSNVERARSTLGAADMVVPTDATQHRIHSLGGVVIGDDVEIGSNTTVDAGTIRATMIGRGTKIDNLCHIGHNVIIGQDCLLAGQSAVAGSAVLGDRVVMGGKSGVADNITIGDDCVLTGASVNLSNVPAGRVMMGYPATKIDVQVSAYKAFRRLPRILRDLGPRQKSVSKQDESD